MNQVSRRKTDLSCLINRIGFYHQVQQKLVLGHFIFFLRRVLVPMGLNNFSLMQSSLVLFKTLLKNGIFLLRLLLVALVNIPSQPWMVISFVPYALQPDPTCIFSVPIRLTLEEILVLGIMTGSKTLVQPLRFLILF